MMTGEDQEQAEAFAYQQKPEVQLGRLLALCRWTLQTLQNQPSGCDHEPACFYRMDNDTMLALRNRLARGVEQVDEGLADGCSVEYCECKRFRRQGQGSREGSDD